MISHGFPLYLYLSLKYDTIWVRDKSNKQNKKKKKSKNERELKPKDTHTVGRVKFDERGQNRVVDILQENEYWTNYIVKSLSLIFSNLELLRFRLYEQKSMIAFMMMIKTKDDKRSSF